MRKRAGLARAMALDPEILFFDEPSAGLDPISSRLLDDLILELRDSLGATIAVVTHELASIFAIGNNSIFLDADTKTMIAQGDPGKLRDECPDPQGAQFPAARRAGSDGEARGRYARRTHHDQESQPKAHRRLRRRRHRAVDRRHCWPSAAASFSQPEGQGSPVLRRAPSPASMSARPSPSAASRSAPSPDRHPVRHAGAEAAAFPSISSSNPEKFQIVSGKRNPTKNINELIQRGACARSCRSSPW